MNQLEAERSHRKQLEEALSNLLSYAENLPARDADLWHGWDDFQANIKHAREILRLAHSD